MQHTYKTRSARMLGDIARELREIIGEANAVNIETAAFKIDQLEADNVKLQCELIEAKTHISLPINTVQEWASKNAA